MVRLRSRIPAVSWPICGYIMGSPPHMETTGAPHSSTAARHSSSGTRSVMLDSYSRMRPHPVHVRLQACSGSRSEEHTSELQSLRHLVCRLLLEKKKKIK